MRAIMGIDGDVPAANSKSDGKRRRTDRKERRDIIQIRLCVVMDLLHNQHGSLCTGNLRDGASADGGNAENATEKRFARLAAQHPYASNSTISHQTARDERLEIV